MSSKLMILTVLGFFSGVNTYAGGGDLDQPFSDMSTQSPKSIMSEQHQFFDEHAAAELEAKHHTLESLLDQGSKIILSAFYLGSKLDEAGNSCGKYGFSCSIHLAGIYGLSSSADSPNNLDGPFDHLAEAIEYAERDFRINQILLPRWFAGFRCRLNPQLERQQVSQEESTVTKSVYSTEEFARESDLMMQQFETHSLELLTSLNPSVVTDLDRIMTKRTYVWKDNTLSISIKKENGLIVIRYNHNDAYLAQGATFSEAVTNLIANRTHF